MSKQIRMRVRQAQAAMHTRVDAGYDGTQVEDVDCALHTYIYIYIYIYVCMDAYIWVYALVCLYMCIYIYDIHTYSRETYVNGHVYVDVHAKHNIIAMTCLTYINICVHKICIH